MIHADYAEFVWTNLSRLGVADADLEDMLQEVFVVVHRRLASYDHTSSLRTWLFGISLRVASTYRRSARRRPPHAHDLSDASVGPIDAPSPEQQAGARELADELERALDALDPEKRAVFVMFEVDEMPCNEIAALMGIPVGTVYSRLHFARHAVARALEAWSPEAR